MLGSLCDDKCPIVVISHHFSAACYAFNTLLEAHYTLHIDLTSGSNDTRWDVRPDKMAVCPFSCEIPHFLIYIAREQPRMCRSLLGPVVTLALIQKVSRMQIPHWAPSPFCHGTCLSKYLHFLLLVFVPYTPPAQTIPGRLDPPMKRLLFIQP